MLEKKSKRNRKEIRQKPVDTLAQISNPTGKPTQAEPKLFVSFQAKPANLRSDRLFVLCSGYFATVACLRCSLMCNTLSRLSSWTSDNACWWTCGEFAIFTLIAIGGIREYRRLVNFRLEFQAGISKISKEFSTEVLCEN